MICNAPKWLDVVFPAFSVLDCVYISTRLPCKIHINKYMAKYITAHFSILPILHYCNHLLFNRVQNFLNFWSHIYVITVELFVSKDLLSFWHSTSVWRTDRQTSRRWLYISTLLQPVSTLSTRSTVLRSASNLNLFLPRSRLKLGERAFSIAAPKSWNTLPLTVRQTSNTERSEEKKK